MSDNILQIIPQLDIGGAERTTIEVAEAITNNGGKAFVFSNGGRLENELKKVGGILIKGDAKTKNPFKILIGNVNEICNIIKQNNIKIVHARSRAPAISAYFAAKKCGVHFVTTYHGIYNAKSKLKRWYNSFMARGEIVIANSEYTKAHLLKEHNIDPKKVRVIYRGVDIEKFTPENIKDEQKQKLINAWEIKEPNLPKILLPARLTNWKGQKVLIEAAKILKDKGILANYILAGDAQGRVEYQKELEDLIEKYGLKDYFYLVGHCSDIPAAIAICDIVTTPSIEPEAFGRTAAEAQAMEKPIIASKLGGAMETVIHEKTGFLFEANNYEQLALYIEKIIKMPNFEKENMGKFARQRIVETFSARSLQQNTLKVYKEIISE